MYGGFDTFGYEYYAEPPATTGGEVFGFAGMLLGVFAAIYLIALAISIVLYIFQSIGIYSVAKRRGIHNPWLAWIPVGVLWILGSISDQYQYVAKGKVRNRRKVLLGVSIAMFASLIVEVIAAIAMAVAAIVGESLATAGAGILLVVLFYLAVIALAIIVVVFTYIAMYDLYASCDPSNATTFLVLSILFPVAQPFFMFFSRKKDWGMPPRKEETQPAPQPIAEIPAEPVVTEEAVVAEAPVAEEAPAVEETPEETE